MRNSRISASANIVFGFSGLKNSISWSFSRTEMANHSFERLECKHYNCAYFVILNEGAVLSPKEASVHVHSSVFMTLAWKMESCISKIHFFFVANPTRTVY